MLQVAILQNSRKTFLSYIEKLLCAGTLHIRKLSGYWSVSFVFNNAVGMCHLRVVRELVLFNAN